MNNLVTSSGCERKTIYGCIVETVAKKPDAAALVVLEKDGSESIVTWNELRCDVDKMAVYLRGLGVCEKTRVVVALPNGIPAVITALAVWRLGACPFFLSSQLVPGEQKILLSQIDPLLVAASWKVDGYDCLDITRKLINSIPQAENELPDYISEPGMATATGGSTGIPKVIVENECLVYGEKDFEEWEYVSGFGRGNTQLTCGSLHHSLFNNSFYIGMAMGCTNVLLKRFSESIVLKSIEKYKVNSLVLVPTMMSRIIRCPELTGADVNSLSSVLHAGAACPKWLKKEWIELVGAEHVYEFYSMSEKVGMTCIRGDEWLKHEGSVGLPVGARLEILSDEGERVPVGTVGNVYFIAEGHSSTNYLKADQQMAKAADNSVSVGDLGYLDEDGYLFLVDRRSDMIVSGGKNIYAAEVENILREYKKIKDIVVIGLSDPNWGRRVHAVIETTCPAEEFDIYEFASFGFRRMSSAMLPKTVELMSPLPRDESGKIRRKLLVNERDGLSDAAMKFRFINVPNGHQIYAWRAARMKNKKVKVRIRRCTGFMPSRTSGSARDTMTDIE